MPKPNEKFTVAQLKDFIRTHKNIKIKLSQTKPNLIADLKKAGQWEGMTESKEKKSKPKQRETPVKGSIPTVNVKKNDIYIIDMKKEGWIGIVDKVIDGNTVDFVKGYYLEKNNGKWYKDGEETETTLSGSSWYSQMLKQANKTTQQKNKKLYQQIKKGKDFYDKSNSWIKS